jgi:hypothetical protein
VPIEAIQVAVGFAPAWIPADEPAALAESRLRGPGPVRGAARPGPVSFILNGSRSGAVEAGDIPPLLVQSAGPAMVVLAFWPGLP